MERKQLESLGLTKEQIDSVMAENGKDIEKAKGESAETKAELEQKTEQIKQLNEQITERDKQLETLKSSAGDSEQLKKKLEEMEQLNKKEKEKYEQKLKDIKKDQLINEALLKSQAKNTKAARALLNEDAITLDGDKIIGLNEQIEAIKESDSYIFKQAEESKPQIVKGAKGQGATMTKEDFDKMSYEEKANLYTSNQALYNELKGGVTNGND